MQTTEHVGREHFVSLYRRELPGGGQVTIQARSGTRRPCEARVMVERRSDPRRREGHVAPVIAEIEEHSQTVAFRQLYSIAADNVAIARGLIAWQSRRTTA